MRCFNAFTLQSPPQADGGCNYLGFAGETSAVGRTRPVASLPLQIPIRSWPAGSCSRR